MFTAPQIIGRFPRVLHAILRAERIEIVVHGHGDLIVFRNGHIIQLQNERSVTRFQFSASVTSFISNVFSSSVVSTV